MLAFLLVLVLIQMAAIMAANEPTAVVLQSPSSSLPTCSPHTRRPHTSRPTRPGQTYRPTGARPCPASSTLDGQDAYAFFLTASPTTQIPTGYPTAVPL